MTPATPNPLSLGSHATWDRLIASVHPASMIVAVGGMMSDRLLRQFEPADVWQEALLMAWRDRARLQWQGPSAFRRWLLEIARNRVRDLADHVGAEKRGRPLALSDLGPDSASSPGDGHYAGPLATTSPGRAAADRELAQQLQAALAVVPEESREVVRLRLFEDLTMEEVAARTGLGVEGARYRFGRGLEIYRRELRRLRVADTQGRFST